MPNCIVQKKISTIAQNQINRFKTDKSITVNCYKQLLIKKRTIQKDICKTCSVVMYFGDENEVLKLSYPNQASPDRINDDNIFYDFDNFNLVCVSCNYNGKKNIRRYIPNQHKNEPVAFTPELLEACNAWLKA
jgi:hypothetical protein